MSAHYFRILSAHSRSTAYGSAARPAVPAVAVGGAAVHPAVARVVRLPQRVLGDGMRALITDLGWSPLRAGLAHEQQSSTIGGGTPCIRCMARFAAPPTMTARTAPVVGVVNALGRCRSRRQRRRSFSRTTAPNYALLVQTTSLISVCDMSAEPTLASIADG